MLHWWDAYPVPDFLPAPYSDSGKYGILPAWGYAEILESRIDGLDAGRLLWGFHSSASLPTDLKLVPATVEGHWIETSEHRLGLQNMYQRFMLVDASLRAASLDHPATLNAMASKANAHVLWEAGYLLNKVFSFPPVPPMGVIGEWTEDDADLTSAVVISLSTSGRTARSFTDTILNCRQAGEGPLGLLGITATGGDLMKSSKIPTKVVPYQQMMADSTYKWISERKAKKIVVLDFGGRERAFDKLVPALEQAFPDVVVYAIGIGGEAKANSLDYIQTIGARYATAPNRHRMNTTGLRDAMKARLGEPEYFDELDRAFKEFERRGGFEYLKLEVGNGLDGKDGFANGWSLL